MKKYVFSIDGRRKNASAAADAITSGISYTTVKETMKYMDDVKALARPAEPDDATFYLWDKFTGLIEGRQRRTDYTEIVDDEVVRKFESDDEVRLLERQIDTAYLQGYIAGVLDRDALLQRKVFARVPGEVVETITRDEHGNVKTEEQKDV